ncbi:MAG: XRE family transcriptional regulator [Mycobacterium sp.]|nr:MAG: XRE family transcriptional regulator [Mycobacterium sp.]
MTDWQQDQVNRVGEAIKALRGERSTQWISDVTDELGQRVSRSTITDIEIGRRKYVALHEISLIAAALGTTPAVLLTYGRVPDGDVEVLPNRRVDAHTALDWWGGTPISRFTAAAQGLPSDNPAVAELVNLSRERDKVRVMLAPAFIGGMGDIDPAVESMLREKLSGVVRRIRELGGMVRDG